MSLEDASLQIEFREMSLAADAIGVLPMILPWIHESSDRFFDFLFHDLGDVREVLATWAQKPSSEFSLSRTTLAFHNDCVVGGFIAGAGAAMTKARSLDLMTLLRTGNSEYKAEIARRLTALKVDLGAMDERDYYLRALGVAADWRGRGVGRRLLAEFARRGTTLGFQRLRLDVYETNQTAIKLYQSAGFEISRQALCAALGMRVLAMVRAV